METVIVLYITYQEGMVTGLRLKTISLNFDRFSSPSMGRCKCIGPLSCYNKKLLNWVFLFASSCVIM